MPDMTPREGECENMTEADLAMRLDRLERDNKRLKRSLAVTLISLLALAAIGATEYVPKKITAHELDIVDDQGRMRVAVGTGFLSGVQRPSVGLFDATGSLRAEIAVEDDGHPSLALYGERNASALIADVWPPGKPSLELGDSEGFTMDLGSTSTVKPSTGEKQQTSAASITMFGNDKKHRVIWQAP
jgi:hypothetical protein